MNVITLTTDFGTADWFVGAMKGVILKINPRAVIVDLTHDIPAGGVRQGAFVLRAAYACFPRGTIHVVVVDPGVGSARRAVVVRTGNYQFVAPDNGILSQALAEQNVKAIREITNEKLMLRPVSRTFHGRDIFAPVAAHLSKGARLSEVGPSAKDLLEIHWPQPTARKDRVDGEILYVDHFGNGITNMPHLLIPRGRATILSGRRRLATLGDHYQAVPTGKAVAVAGSSGMLEIAVNGGHAARQLRLKIGTKISVRVAAGVPLPGDRGILPRGS